MTIRYITRQSVRDCKPPSRDTDRNRNPGAHPTKNLKTKVILISLICNRKVRMILTFLMQIRQSQNDLNFQILCGMGPRIAIATRITQRRLQSLTDCLVIYLIVAQLPFCFNTFKCFFACERSVSGYRHFKPYIRSSCSVAGRLCSPKHYYHNWL